MYINKQEKALMPKYISAFYKCCKDQRCGGVIMREILFTAFTGEYYCSITFSSFNYKVNILQLSSTSQ